MAVVIQIQSFKGGVGKTTTTINLAHGMALKGKKVLVIDLDHQGNSTSGFGYAVTPETPTLFHIISGDRTFEETRATVRDNIDLIPSDKRTAVAEEKLLLQKGGETVLKRKFKNLSEYDFVLLDCAAGLGQLHVNALLFATHLLVPLQAGKWAVDGVEQIFDSMQEVDEIFDYMPDFLGAVLTMVDERYGTTAAVREFGNTSFGEKMLPAIRTSGALMRAPDKNQTIFEFNARSKGAKDYNALTETILNKFETENLIEEK